MIPLRAAGDREAGAEPLVRRVHCRFLPHAAASRLCPVRPGGPSRESPRWFVLCPQRAACSVPPAPPAGPILPARTTAALCAFSVLVGQWPRGGRGAPHAIQVHWHRKPCHALSYTSSLTDICILSLAHPHAHTHSHGIANTLPKMHKNTPMSSKPAMQSHTFTCTHLHLCTLIPCLPFSQTLAILPTLTRIHTHTHSRSHLHNRMHSHTHIRSHNMH